MPAQAVRFIDLFAGIGGFRYGLENANTISFRGGEENANFDEKKNGERLDTILEESVDSEKRQHSRNADDQSSQRKFTCVYTNEWDKYAADIYEKNFQDQVDRRDITTVPSSDIPDHDLLVGGFPCQAFSIAGKRRGFDDTRGTLFFEIARILRDKRPRYFLLENVKGLLSHDSGKTFSTILGVLSDLGYDYQWQILNSKNFGVPQNRERIFIVGNLRGESRPEVFPIRGNDQVDGGADTSQTANTLTANYWKGPAASRPLVYVGGILSKRKWLEDGKNFSRNFPQGQRVYSTEGVASTLAGNAGGLGGKTGLYAVPAQIGQGKKSRAAQSGTIIGSQEEAYTLRASNPNGVAIPVLTPDRKEKRQNGRRFKTNGEPAFTVNTQDRHGVYDGYKIRKLTPIECERLQGFPDEWTKGVSDTQRYKCLGNAVTTNVVEEIGRRMLRYIQ